MRLRATRLTAIASVARRVLAEYFLNGTGISNLSAPITLAAGANAITGTGTRTLSGVIQDGQSASSITYSLGTGSTLTVSGNNTYTGGTTITAGTIKAAHANAFGSTGAIAVRGGALDITALTYTEQQALITRITVSETGTVKRYAFETDYSRVFDYSADNLTAGALTTWNDLSGNNRHLTISGNVSAALLNGKMTVYSDGNSGANSRARWTGTAFTPSARWLIVALTAWYNAGSQYGRLVSLNTDITAGEWGRNNTLFFNRNVIADSYSIGNMAGNHNSAAGYIDGVMGCRVARYRDGNIKVRKNGIDWGNSAMGAVSNVGVITLFDDSTIDPGNGNGVHNCRRMVMIDCGVSGDPDAVAVQMEGVMLWRDGLQAQLPANHTYKNAPPMATVSAGSTVIS